MTDRAMQHAQQILDVRRRRTEFFKSELFDEQDWDLMLVLFVASYDDQRMDRATLLARIAVSEAVLDRWISVLGREDILDQRSIAADDLRLSDTARRGLHALLTETATM